MLLVWFSAEEGFERGGNREGNGVALIAWIEFDDANLNNTVAMGCIDEMELEFGEVASKWK